MKPSPKKNAAAVALGRRAQGKPKTLTPAALEQRRRAGFKPRRLPAATLQAARAAAQDDATFTAPSGKAGNDE